MIVTVNNFAFIHVDLFSSNMAHQMIKERKKQHYWRTVCLRTKCIHFLNGLLSVHNGEMKGLFCETVYFACYYMLKHITTY
jgi:hypothetical protein